jgi:hypothetical protein
MRMCRNFMTTLEWVATKYGDSLNRPPLPQTFSLRFIQWESHATLKIHS